MISCGRSKGEHSNNKGASSSLLHVMIIGEATQTKLRNTYRLYRDHTGGNY